MAVEYIVSDVIGNGQWPGRGEALTDLNGPYRPAAEQYCTQFVNAIDIAKADIALTKAIDPDLVGLGNDNRCQLVPGATLDDVYTPGTANTVNNWLEAHSIPRLIVAGDTKLIAIEKIGTYINPGFGSFSVGGQ